MYGPPVHAPPPRASESAPRGRRLLAWAIDSGVLLVVAALLGGVTWARLQAYAAEDVPHKAWAAGVALLLSGGDVGKAVAEFGAGVWGAVVAMVDEALLLLVLVELLHQFAAAAWTGRTVGKAAADLRVRRAADPDARPGKARALRRALVATASGTGLYALAWALLLEGLFVPAVLLWLIAVAFFLANGVPALVGRRRTLADRAGGTVVLRARTYRRAVAAARQGAVRAQAGAQAVQGNAARLARQAAESDRARRLHELGRQSADRVRDAAAGERARRLQDGGRRLGGRARDAYRKRRGETQPALPPPQPPYGQPMRQDAPRQWPHDQPPV
ncbi:RDD family protein [Actinomadura atramentaria]|uniref:RDD family protein n=1 Tax=Actinomadura atramentaria TaxID=1990 RepID=UPI000373D365|nr:RDD family protein [Actinomadura atramentaria]